jgi:histidinol-phosphatase (PHP family)
MDWEEMGAYCEGIEQAREQFPQLTILAGMELDYFPKFGADFHREQFQKWNLDYYIGGVHYIFDNSGELIWRPKRGSSGNVYLKNYIKQSLELMETGLLDYYAHPDIIGMAIGNWDAELESAFGEMIEAAVEHDIPLEINAYGIRKGKKAGTSDNPCVGYPLRPFWELAAKYGAKAVIGADAHSPETFLFAWDQCVQILDEFGMKPCNEELVQKILNRRNG